MPSPGCPCQLAPGPASAGLGLATPGTPQHKGSLSPLGTCQPLWHGLGTRLGVAGTGGGHSSLEMGRGWRPCAREGLGSLCKSGFGGSCPMDGFGVPVSPLHWDRFGVPVLEVDLGIPVLGLYQDQVWVSPCQA